MVLLVNIFTGTGVEFTQVWIIETPASPPSPIYLPPFLPSSMTREKAYDAAAATQRGMARRPPPPPPRRRRRGGGNAPAHSKVRRVVRFHAVGGRGKEGRKEGRWRWKQWLVKRRPARRWRCESPPMRFQTAQRNILSRQQEKQEKKIGFGTNLNFTHGLLTSTLSK